MDGTDIRIKRGMDIRIKRATDMRIKHGTDMRIKHGSGTLYLDYFVFKKYEHFFAN